MTQSEIQKDLKYILMINDLLNTAPFFILHMPILEKIDMIVFMFLMVKKMKVYVKDTSPVTF